MCTLPHLGLLSASQRGDRRQQVQGGERPRPELHARQDGPAHGSDRGERRRYLQQLDTADRQEPSDALKTKTSRLKEKIEKLKEQMQRLEVLKVTMLAAPDQQISLTDPDARSMATSGRGSGVVGYNVQVAVDTTHHLIITHEVINEGIRPVATLSRGQGGEGNAGSGEARCRRRSRLLQ